MMNQQYQGHYFLGPTTTACEYIIFGSLDQLEAAKFRSNTSWQRSLWCIVQVVKIKGSSSMKQHFAGEISAFMCPKWLL